MLLTINCCLTEHCLFCWLLASFFTFYGSKLYFTASVWMIGLQWCPVLQLGVGYFASCGALFHNFTSHCHVYPIFATGHQSGDDIIQIIGEMQLWNQVCRGKNFRNQNYDERASCINEIASKQCVSPILHLYSYCTITNSQIPQPTTIHASREPEQIPTNTILATSPPSGLPSPAINRPMHLTIMDFKFLPISLV